MKTTIQNHISQTELKEALSEYFKNYNIKINHNLIYINSSDVNFYLSISGKEIKLGRVADFGDFILFLNITNSFYFFFYYRFTIK